MQKKCASVEGVMYRENTGVEYLSSLGQSAGDNMFVAVGPATKSMTEAWLVFCPKPKEETRKSTTNRASDKTDAACCSTNSLCNRYQEASGCNNPAVAINVNVAKACVGQDRFKGQTRHQ